jgi:bacterioferritin
VQKLGRKWRKISIEEMYHADDLIARVIFLEGHPNLQHLEPLRIGETVREVLDADLRSEYLARALYKEACEVCRSEGDHVSRVLMETLIADEEAHIDLIETLMDLYDEIGEAQFIIANAKPADEAD